MDGKLPRSGSTPSIIFRGRRGKNGAPERMEIVAGTSFDVPCQSGFTIEVSAGLCEYICSFL